jgi:hypothetical protein
MHVSFLPILLLKTIIQDVFQRNMQFSQTPGEFMLFLVFFDQSQSLFECVLVDAAMRILTYVRGVSGIRFK